MAAIFSIDGIEYDVKIPVGGFQRKGEILDGDAAGRSKSGNMIFDTIGTYYNYYIKVKRSGNNLADYDALYQVVTSPSVRAHTIVIPYAQGTITFDAYVSGVTDELKKVKDENKYWDNMTIDIIATAPYRTP